MFSEALKWGLALGPLQPPPQPVTAGLCCPRWFQEPPARGEAHGFPQRFLGGGRTLDATFQDLFVALSPSSREPCPHFPPPHGPLICSGLSRWWLHLGACLTFWDQTSRKICPRSNLDSHTQMQPPCLYSASFTDLLGSPKRYAPRCEKLQVHL